MKITIDFESRATVDLPGKKKGEIKQGLYPYGEDPQLDVLCLVIKENNNDPHLWVPDKFWHMTWKDLFISKKGICDLINEADIIEAHNMNFERVIWHYYMVKRHDFPPLPFEKLRCSAAKASFFAIPRDLKRACQVMRVSQQKDDIGYKIMMKMSRPRKPSKNNPDIWNEDPEDFRLLCDYCRQDVEAEYELSKSLPDLSEIEQEIWRLDQKINDRGIKIDIPAIDNLIEKINEKETKLLLETQELTQGRLKSPRQTKALGEWLEEHGVPLPNVQKETVKEALEGELPDRVRKVLTIRQSLSKTSVAKLQALLNRASSDGRVRGAFMYHTATTGRWSSKGVQFHNLPRETYGEEDIAEILDGDIRWIEALYGCPIQAASKCVRGMIIPEKGSRLICNDFKSIEAVGLAWLAGEMQVLEDFINGIDLYISDAVKVFNILYEAIDQKQRQIGKVCRLSLGFQGWVQAFQSMARTHGVHIEDDLAKDIISKWRDNNRKIVRLWRGLEDAARETVLTGRTHSYGRIKFGRRGRFLHCRLPSGRCLSYCDPRIKIIDKWGEKKPVIAFMGIDSQTGKWVEQTTYGGKLAENVTQATARDLLAEAMLRLDKVGYNIVYHTHDDIKCEEKIGNGKTLKEMSEIMEIVPEWAEGLPIKVDGWEGYRNRK